MGQGFSVAAEQKTAVPLAPRSNLYSDFKNRLEAAIESRDVVTIRALYQTNGATVEELKLEIVQWRQMLSGEAKARVSCYFKELGTLPPQAREVWGAQAHRLTKHEVTHLVFLQTGTRVRVMLPLVVVDDRLLILPSDGGKTGMHIEPDGAANGSQPIRPETNGTSSAAGSRR